MEPTQSDFRLFNRKLRTRTAWLVFLGTGLLYLYCREGSGSYWDCSEFIASAWHLQNPHPPGAPLFLMLGRVGMVLFGGAPHAASVLSALSALASAATIALVFQILWMLAAHLGGPSAPGPFWKQATPLLAASLCGALIFAFSDCFWSSAAEAEVYALSVCLSSLLIYVLLRSLLEPGNWAFSRWMLLACFLMGLSFGVHPMSLLLVPLFILAPYLRSRHPRAWKAWAWILAGLAILYAALALLLPALLRLSAGLDRWMADSLRTPVWSGWLAFWILISAALAFGSRSNRRLGSVPLKLLCLGLLLFLAGSSSYLEVPIRAVSEPAINIGRPADPYAFMNYLLRKEYPAAPLLVGAPFDVSPVGYQQRSKTYRYDPVAGRYTAAYSGFQASYSFSSDRLFPRIWDHSPAAVAFYRDWLNLKPGRMASPEDGLYFFLSYQLDWMGLRYLMWNFVGRQNDRQGFGNARDGNWKMGLPLLDRLHAFQNPLSSPEPGSHAYWALPLLLALAGWLYQARRDRRMAWLLEALFTGGFLAVVLGLNASGPQARERDYVFLLGYMAVSLWAGLGALRLLQSRWLASRSYLAFLPLLLPAWMGLTNFHDHNRHQLHLAADMAHNLLASCPDHAILLVQADNDTYPLWYAQQVEGYRTDVRVVNTSLLELPDYASELASAAVPGGPIPLMGSGAGSALPELVRCTPQPADTAAAPADLKGVLDALWTTAGKSPGNLAALPGIPATALGLYSGTQLQGRLTPSGPYLDRAALYELSLLASQWGRRPLCLADRTLLRALHPNFSMRQRGLVWQLEPAKDTAAEDRLDLLHQAALLQDSMRFGGASRGVYLDQNGRCELRRLRDASMRCALQLEHSGAPGAAKQLLVQAAAHMPDAGLPYAEPSSGNWIDRNATRFALACYLAKDTSLANHVSDAILLDLDNQLRAALTAPSYLVGKDILGDLQTANRLSSRLRGYRRLYGGYGIPASYLKNWPSQHQHLLNDSF